MKRASSLLDHQLKHIRRMVDDGVSGSLLRSRVAALLEYQIQDREDRLELLLRTTQLLADLDRNSREIPRRRAGQSCCVPQDRTA